RLWFRRGLALKELDRPTEALIAFESALDIHALDPDIWAAQGLTLLEMEDYPAAPYCPSPSPAA
ncbi:MAG: hypothetical protein HC792_00860, partial [Acaryochloridaceae cyanobacterium CSU_5_19]|nr:hypothetical protein [Acaryochloridaceae cyanobacterium CSU_5_19]